MTAPIRPTPRTKDKTLNLTESLEHDRIEFSSQQDRGIFAAGEYFRADAERKKALALGAVSFEYSGPEQKGVSTRWTEFAHAKLLLETIEGAKEYQDAVKVLEPLLRNIEAGRVWLEHEAQVAEEARQALRDAEAKAKAKLDLDPEILAARAKVGALASV